MKRYRTTTCLLIMLLAISTGCDKQAKLPVESLEALDKRLRVAPEFQQLEAIRNEVLTRLVQHQVSKEKFILAYSSRDSERARQILGYTEQEANDLSERFAASVRKLRKNFPELLRLDKSSLKKCKTGGVKAFVEHYEEAVNNYRNVLSVRGKQAVSCEWGQYTVCLGVAAVGAGATAPTVVGPAVVYAAGSYLCLCSYCSGGWVDWACF